MATYINSCLGCAYVLRRGTTQGFGSCGHRFPHKATWGYNGELIQAFPDSPCPHYKPAGDDSRLAGSLPSPGAPAGSRFTYADAIDLSEAPGTYFDGPESTGHGAWWHDPHTDGDADGLGALRGVRSAIAVLAVLIGAAFAIVEVGGHLSGAARVGVAAVTIGSLCTWRSIYQFTHWADHKPAAVAAVTFFAIAAWSLAVWGW